MSETIGIWIAAALTIMILSFLYKDNPFYKFAEHLFVGIAAGYILALSWHNTIRPNLTEPLFAGKDWWLIVPAVFGVLLFSRFIKSISWLSQWSLAAIVGIYAGLAVTAFAEADFVQQLHASMLPLFSADEIAKFQQHPGIITFLHVTTNFITVIGLLAILVYFFFSKEHTGGWGTIAKFGTGLLMMGFGAGYGYTVMTRIALLIDRIFFLLSDFLHIL